MVDKVDKVSQVSYFSTEIVTRLRLTFGRPDLGHLMGDQITRLTLTLPTLHSTPQLKPPAARYVVEKQELGVRGPHVAAEGSQVSRVRGGEGYHLQLNCYPHPATKINHKNLADDDKTPARDCQ